MLREFINKYKINYVAKILGLTPQAIRYYEKKGLILPARIEENQYRSYDAWDIVLLLRTRAYREYGFAVNEIVDILRDGSPERLIEKLEKRAQEVEAEIEKLKTVLSGLKYFSSRMQFMQENKGRYLVAERPAMYMLYIQKEYEMSDDPDVKKMLSEWCENPNVFPCTALFLDDITSKDFIGAQCMLAEDAKRLQIQEGRFVSYIEPRTCVYAVIEISSREELTNKILQPILDYMKKVGLKPVDDIFARWLVVNKMESQYKALAEVWIPIEDKTKLSLLYAKNKIDFNDVICYI